MNTIVLKSSKRISIATLSIVLLIFLAWFYSAGFPRKAIIPLTWIMAGLTALELARYTEVRLHEKHIQVIRPFALFLRNTRINLAEVDSIELAPVKGPTFVFHQADNSRKSISFSPFSKHELSLLTQYLAAQNVKTISF